MKIVKSIKRKIREIDDVYSKCKFCGRSMRSLKNQKYLITARPELHASTLEDIRKHLKCLYEVEDKLCNYCKKFH